MAVSDNSRQLNREMELIRRISGADEKALECLYHDYYRRLFRFVARIARKDHAVEAIINDVMLVVWQKASTYNYQCRPSTWIFGIAYNKVRQACAENTVENEEPLDVLDRDAVFCEDACAGLHRLETEEWLERGLERLSVAQRTVIELTYYQGLHYSEIAKLMDCPENTVKTRMHHARRKLAAILKNSR